MRKELQLAVGSVFRDRRRFPRWEVDLPCRFEAGRCFRDGTLVDLSVGGAFIESRSSCPPINSLVRVVLTLFGQSLALEGRVRHSGWFLLGYRNGHGFGVEFNELASARVAGLEEQLLSLDPPESKVSMER